MGGGAQRRPYQSDLTSMSMSGMGVGGMGGGILNQRCVKSSVLMPYTIT